MDRKQSDNTSAELYTRIFNENANSHHCWQSSGQKLKRSADILNKYIQIDIDKANNSNIGDSFDPFIDSVGLMIMGFALENLLKGIYVGRGNVITANNNLVTKNINHKILDLYAMLNIELSTDEFDFVERTEQFIIWAGRYPLPLKLHDFKAKKLPTGGFGPLSYTSSSDYKMFCKLYEDLELILIKCKS